MPQRRKPVTADSLFPAASLGKPVFAYAALRLVDDAKLDLDRPLKAYVPDHAPADARGDKITPRQVLSHSTGFRNWRNSIEQPLTPDFDPGSRFQYSGEGFYYLQRAVEKITGVAFEQFMQTRLFEPFGMRSSTYGWREDTDARLVTGHNRGNPVRGQSRDFANRLLQHAQSQGKPLSAFTHDDVVAAMGTLKPSPPALPNFIIPNSAGSMLTTVADYTTYLSHVLAPSGGASEISTKSRDQMFTAHDAHQQRAFVGTRMGSGERPGARLHLALGRQRKLQELRARTPAVAFSGRRLHERQQRDANQRSCRRRGLRTRALRVRLALGTNASQLPTPPTQRQSTAFANNHDGHDGHDVKRFLASCSSWSSRPFRDSSGRPESPLADHVTSLLSEQLEVASFGILVQRQLTTNLTVAERSSETETFRSAPPSTAHRFGTSVSRTTCSPAGVLRAVKTPASALIGPPVPPGEMSTVNRSD